MNATSLRDLLQQAVDRRNADGRDATFRALQEAVEAEESTRPRGLSLNRTTASQILRGTYKGEPSDGTIRAIGWLAGVGDEDAFAAAGRRSPGLPFAEELPPGVDDLSPKERRAAIEMLRTLVAQRREINRYVDSSTGTQEPRASREAPPRKKTAHTDDELDLRRNHRDQFKPGPVDSGAAAYDPPGPADADEFGEVSNPDGPEGSA